MQRLVVALAVLGCTLSIVSVEVMCLYREMCFRSTYATSVDLATRAAFPIAAVAVLVVFPLAAVSVRLHRVWLVGLSAVVTGLCAVALLIGSIWAFGDVGSSAALDEAADDAWGRFTAQQRMIWRDDRGRLRSTIRDDALTAGAFALAGSVVLVLVTVLQVLLYVVWTALSVAPDACCGVFGYEKRGRNAPLRASIRAKAHTQQSVEGGQHAGQEAKEEEGPAPTREEASKEDDDDAAGTHGAGVRAPGSEARPRRSAVEDDADDPYAQ
jgi:hypothetical protein